jgi:AcrR family transcriptional regulator
MSLSRREKQKQATYHEIIRTARCQIAEVGAANLSLRAVAREMGLTAPALYRYFDDRDALVTALIALGYESLTTRLNAAREVLPVDAHADRLMQIGLAYRLWGLENPELSALIFGTPIPGYQTPPEATTPLAQSALGVLVDVLANGAWSGVFQLPENNSPLHPDLIEAQSELAALRSATHMALRLWGLVHGLTSLEIFNHFDMLLADAESLYVNALQDVIQSILMKGF